MKKIISFEKELEFNTMIGEISSIALDEDLKFINQSEIEGNFFINGTYKMTEATQIEDSFAFKIPVEITLLESLDLNTAKIEIEDFKYEIKDDNYLDYHIDILIEGVEEVNIGEDEEERECDGEKRIPSDDENTDIKEIDTITFQNNDELLTDENIKIDENSSSKQIVEQNSLENKNVIIEEKKEISKNEPIKKNANSLFSSLSNEDETYSTYSVYIIRENETLTSIMNKYKVTKEELENYNDLSNISIGTKLIIPAANE